MAPGRLQIADILLTDEVLHGPMYLNHRKYGNSIYLGSCKLFPQP